MMDVLVMDALMIGTLLAGFGLLRLFLGWCIDQTEGTGKKNQSAEWFDQMRMQVIRRKWIWRE